MKNFTKLALIFIVLIFTACGAKVPFSKEQPFKDASLVYIYAPASIGSTDEMSDSIYNVHINNKRVDGKIQDGEYMKFHLKPNMTKFSVIRGAIIEKSLSVDLKEGKIYYLKVKSNSESNSFELINMNEEIALLEIAKTGLAGSVAVEEDNILTELIDEKKTPISKTQEIEKAYSLKEKGILTDAEFKKLKAEILAK